MVFSILSRRAGNAAWKIFLTLADQMRLKRFHGRKESRKAETQITYPGMLLMVACMISAVGPFCACDASGYLP